MRRSGWKTSWESSQALRIGRIATGHAIVGTALVRRGVQVSRLQPRAPGEPSEVSDTIPVVVHLIEEERPIVLETKPSDRRRLPAQFGLGDTLLKAGKARRDWEQWFQAQPLIALGVSFGAGILLGWLVKRR